MSVTPFSSAPAAVNSWHCVLVGPAVLRDSSSDTPAGHGHPSLRGFFAPAARRQFSGLGLAKDGAC